MARSPQEESISLSQKANVNAFCHKNLFPGFLEEKSYEVWPKSLLILFKKRSTGQLDQKVENVLQY